MKAIFKKVVTGLAYHCATGERVTDQLPQNKELANIIIC